MEGRSDDNRNKKRTGDISAWKRTGREGISGAGVYADRRSWCWETVFTQGFAAGLGITEPVNSPTFTIVQVYEEGRLRFIILTYIALEMWKKWMKWDSKIM